MTISGIDSVSGLSAQEAAEKCRTDGYNKLPESKQRSIFRIIFEVVHEPMFILQGAVVPMVVMGIYFMAPARDFTGPKTQTPAFAAIVIANLSLILTNRSWQETIGATLRSPNRALARVFSPAPVFRALMVFVPALRELFRSGPVPLPCLTVCALAGAVSVTWSEVCRVRSRKGVPAYAGMAQQQERLPPVPFIRGGLPDGPGYRPGHVLHPQCIYRGPRIT